MHGKRELARHRRRESIRFLLPEYWRASTPDDLKLLRELDRPDGCWSSSSADLGRSSTATPTLWNRIESARGSRVAMLREHEPDFMAIHLIALDGVEHREGPFVAPAFDDTGETSIA